MSTFDDILSLIQSTHSKAIPQQQRKLPQTQIITDIPKSVPKQETKTFKIDSVFAPEVQKDVKKEDPKSDVQSKMRALQAKMENIPPKGMQHSQHKIETQPAIREERPKIVFAEPPREQVQQVQRKEIPQPNTDIVSQLNSQIQLQQQEISSLQAQNQQLTTELQNERFKTQSLEEQMSIAQQIIEELEAKAGSLDRPEVEPVQPLRVEQPAQKPIKPVVKEVKNEEAPKEKEVKDIKKEMLPKEELNDHLTSIKDQFNQEWDKLEQDQEVEQNQIKAKEISKPLMGSDDPLFAKQNVFSKQHIISAELAKPQHQSGQELYHHPCLKILIPEQHQLKEAAAKRIVSVEKGEAPCIVWSRQVNDQQSEISGVLPISDIINILAAEDARVFRSRVISARKAGYVQDTFELIQTGILDQIQPKQLIQSQSSVIFFTQQQVICFDFGIEKEQFENFCGVLVDLGL